MPHITHFPILVKRNSEGIITKIVAPDLLLNIFNEVCDSLCAELTEKLKTVTNSTSTQIINQYFYELRDIKALLPVINKILQDYIDQHHLKRIKCTANNERQLKQSPDESFQWLEATVATQNNCRQSANIVSSLVTISFLGTLGLAEYLGYILNVVNKIPTKEAIAAVSTDIGLELITYYASKTSENAGAKFEGWLSTTAPESDYELEDDFEIPASTTKYAYLIAALYVGMQAFNTLVNTRAEYNNLMMQYNYAYDTGEITMNYNDFMTLAKTSFYIDSFWAFVLPLNLALSIAPKIEQLFKRGFSYCFSKRPQETPVARATQRLSIKVEPTATIKNYPSAHTIFNEPSHRTPLMADQSTLDTRPRRERSSCVVM